MSDYLRMGVDKASRTGNVGEAVNLIAKGIVKYLFMTVESFAFPQTKYPHRKIKSLLIEGGINETDYSDWVGSVINGEISRESWAKEIKPALVKWAGLLAKEKLAGTETYLEWNDDFPVVEEMYKRSISNSFKHINGGRSVNITLGSIHSVKGQTHLSTLVLDTIWQDKTAGKTNLAYLIDWLSGFKNGGGLKRVLIIKRE